MPQPLPDAMVATLKADPCAALAAIMIISNAHSELLAWAQRILSPLNVGGDVATNVAAGQNAGETNGAEKAAQPPRRKPKSRKANGGRSRQRPSCAA